MSQLAQINTIQPSPIQSEGFIDATGPQVFGNIITGALSLVFIVGGLTALIMIIMGGFSIITAGGDESRMADGRNKIMWAVIGVLILFASWALIVFIQDVLGVCFGFGNCPLDLDSLTP